MKNKWIHTGAMLLVSACALAGAKPNVLFIAVDDLRPELGCYGKDYIISPNIDRMARAGMVFNRAYCQQATCSPSRTAVLTGVRPDTSKVWDLNTHFRKALPDVVTLGQQFMNNGYFVQGMGKIYHGSLNDEASWSAPWQTPNAAAYALPENEASKPAPGHAPSAKKKTSAAANSRGSVYECADVPDDTYTDGKVADLAVRTLRELSKKTEPFFLAVGFAKPHLPFVAPKKYWDLYDPAAIALAPNPFLPVGAPDYAVNPNDGEIRNYKGVPPRGPFSDELALKLKQAYFACISFSDAQIGKLLDELDRLKLRENTIVILWGDHGWKLGEHGSWGKHTNVENDVNAPLILSVPGMKNQGAHTDALVEFVDIYPTLCDLANLPLPGHLEGTSLKPLLDHPERQWKTAAFSQFPKGGFMGYTMRTDRYRFTIWVDRNDHAKVDAIELYDHKTDPQENTNIAGNPENAALVKKLAAQWEQGWQAATPPLKTGL